ncbi:APC family permease [Alicyclobacillus vulcanalis]|uniref:Amino acid/polyamine/organocation transporter, APC superfamily n=1 Tax=Alicyclobacillus vulcanalis TaxID=252246 RepID=A0A1N7L2M6_9BACL|nr:APC family permease [Alicyclobacillus vulcanalis]SIS68122.1 amino acid/polyamine/organocation transporter, APC superfamily [Alicyclobacillus vulcanalis]
MESTSTLRRTLRLPHVLFFGLVYLAPMVVFAIYGTIVEASKGMAASSYLVAMVAMMFTAKSYGEMVKAYPVSGSSYTYTRRSLNAHVGFMVGWAILLDYVFIPMAIWLIGASYLNAAFPAVPVWVWVLLFILVTTVINLFGIELGANLNVLMMAFQLLVIALFLALGLMHVWHAQQAWSVFRPFASPGGSFSAVLAGASIACYSFLGFDAITTLTEETLEPTRTLPKAIVLVAFLGGVIFIVCSYVGQWVHPSLVFENVNSAAFEIAREIGGTLFSAVFLAGIIVAQFASGLSAQASAARLLYAMGRDAVLPKRVFAYLHSRFRTPVLNVVLIGLLAFMALFMSVETSTSFINFGAFSAFTCVNLSVIAHYIVRQRRRTWRDWTVHFLFPLLGAFFDFWLLLNLDRDALRLGAAWAVLGLLYLAFMTRGFQKEPPELSMDAHGGGMPV